MDGKDTQFSGMRKADFRSLSFIDEVLAKMAAAGFTHVDLTGGEPTLHPNIGDIIRISERKYNIRTRIITLGQYMMKKGWGDAPTAEMLVDHLLRQGLTNLLLSTHATDEELFKKITGESFLRLHSLYTYLSKIGFYHSSNTTVFEWNYRSLPDIAHYISQTNSLSHNFICMNAYYQWNHDSRAYGRQARYSELGKYLSRAVEILIRAGRSVNVRYMPLCQLQGYESHIAGVTGVRYDPYEWMNQEVHQGPVNTDVGSRKRMSNGEIDNCFKYSEVVGESAHVKTLKGETIPIIAVRGNGIKVYPSACSECSMRQQCDGIDPKYIQQYGQSEFIPYRSSVRNYPITTSRASNSGVHIVKYSQHASSSEYSPPSPVSSMCNSSCIVRYTNYSDKLERGNQLFQDHGETIAKSSIGELLVTLRSVESDSLYILDINSGNCASIASSTMLTLYDILHQFTLEHSSLEIVNTLHQCRWSLALSNGRELDLNNICQYLSSLSLTFGQDGTSAFDMDGSFYASVINEMALDYQFLHASCLDHCLKNIINRSVIGDSGTVVTSLLNWRRFSAIAQNIPINVRIDALTSFLFSIGCKPLVANVDTVANSMLFASHARDSASLPPNLNDDRGFLCRIKASLHLLGNLPSIPKFSLNEAIQMSSGIAEKYHVSALILPLEQFSDLLLARYFTRGHSFKSVTYLRAGSRDNLTSLINCTHPCYNVFTLDVGSDENCTINAYRHSVTRFLASVLSNCVLDRYDSSSGYTLICSSSSLPKRDYISVKLAIEKLFLGKGNRSIYYYDIAQGEFADIHDLYCEANGLAEARRSLLLLPSSYLDSLASLTEVLDIYDKHVKGPVEDAKVPITTF